MVTVAFVVPLLDYVLVFLVWPFLVRSSNTRIVGLRIALLALSLLCLACTVITAIRFCFFSETKDPQWYEMTFASLLLIEGVLHGIVAGHLW